MIEARNGRRLGAIARWLLPAAVVLAAPLVARAGDAALDKQIDGLLAEPGDPVRAGIWFGAPSGEPIYQRAADQEIPAASVVKTAILVELFAAHASHLDEPMGAAADAVLADDKHGAMTPFSAGQRDEVRKALRGASVRTVGAIMMGSKAASNAVYNGAANLAIASLGGPADASAKIRARDAAWGGVAVRRYMLAPRTAGADNAATPAALAAVLAAIASAHVPGLDAPTAAAIADTMMKGRDPKLGVHRHKEGNLDSDPMVFIQTGFYARSDGKPPLAYVVGAALSAKPTGSRDAAHRRLEKLTDAMHAALRSVVPR